MPEIKSEPDDNEVSIEDIDIDEDDMPKLTPPEQYFGIDLDDDDDEDDD